MSGRLPMSLKVSDSQEPGGVAGGPPRHRSSLLEVASDGIVEAGWLVALICIPLLVNPFGARGYEPDKIAAFRAIVIVMVVAWLTGALVRIARSWRTGSNWQGVRTPSWAGSTVLLAVLGLGASVVLSSVLSVNPRLSWLGSFERFSGAWTQLSFLVFFGLVAANLRGRAQWRRAAYVITLTSSVVALYAVLQAIGLDPRWSSSDGARVYSTLGNPIFLAGYLVMAVFVTSVELRAAIVAKRSGRASSSRTVVPVLWAILGLQLVAITLSQSRGPVLALATGGLVAVLLASSLLREEGMRTAVIDRVRRTLLVAIPVGIAFLVVAAIPGSPLAASGDLPVFGRLTTALDLEAGSTQVRMAIWEGAIERLESDDPIAIPGGAPDQLESLRPLIGYGPETFRIALDRHIDPILARRMWAPDRAHNEILNVLVTQGVIGLTALLVLYGSTLVLASRAAGALGFDQRAARLRTLLVGGAVAGALGPFLVTGELALAGPGAGAGLVAAVVIAVAVFTRPGTDSGSPSTDRETRWLAVALLAGIVAHITDLNVGIGTSSTRLMFWFFCAVLISMAAGGLTERGPEIRVQTTSKTTRHRQVPVPAIDTSLTGANRWRSAGLGLLLALPIVPVVLLLTTSTESTSIVGVLWTGFASEGRAGGPGALLWLLLWTLGAGTALLPLTLGNARHGFPSTVAWGGGFGLAYLLYQASRVARVASLQQRDLNTAVDYATGHITVVFGIVLAVVVIGGVALAVPALWQSPGRPILPMTLGIIAVGLGGLLAANATLGPVRADMLAHQGTSFSAAGLDEPGLRATAAAVSIDPSEPRYHAADGATAAGAATRSTAPAELTALLARAEYGFRRAVELAPLDPDHHANLGRFFVFETQFADGDVVLALLTRAAESFDAALTLRPNSIAVLEEAAAVQLRLGRLTRAGGLLARAESLARVDSDTAVRPPALGPGR